MNDALQLTLKRADANPKNNIFPSNIAHSILNKMLGVYNIAQDVTLKIYGDMEGEYNRDVFEVDQKNKLALKRLENTHVVLLGDIIDKGKFNIRLLQAIYLRKNTNTTLTCILGNREINKFRLLDEIEIVSVSNSKPASLLSEFNLKNGNSPMNFQKLSFLNMCHVILEGWGTKYKFSKDVNAIIDRYSNPSSTLTLPDHGAMHWTREMTKQFIGLYTDKPSRVEDIMGHVYGANNTVNDFWDELKDMGVVEDIQIPNHYSDKQVLEYVKNIKNIATALLYMIMLLPSDTQINLPNVLVQFQCILYDYIYNAHVLAQIQHDKTSIVVSHSGLPPNGISHPVGFEVTPDMKADMNNIIHMINKQKTLDVQRSHANTYLMNKYISLSANIGVFPVNTDILFGSYFSPIYGHGLNDISKHPFFTYSKTKLKQQYTTEGGRAAHSRTHRGGKNEVSSWWSRITSDESLSAIAYTRETIKEITHYNVFGHQPQGYFPTAILDNEVHHVCLDVSNVDNKNNNSISKACLVFNSKGASVQGSFTFDKTTYNYDTKIEEYERPYSFYADKQVNVIDNSGNKIMTDQIALVNEIVAQNEKGEKNKITFVMTKGYKTHVKVEAITGHYGGRIKHTKYVRTSEKRMYNNRLHIVYMGKRGGKYIKTKGIYIRIRKD